MRFSFQQICGVLPDALLLASCDGRIVDANRAAAQVLRTTAEDLLGNRIQDFATSSGPVEEYLRLCSRTSSATVGVLN
jgi:PAS domain-containing protein